MRGANRCGQTRHWQRWAGVSLILTAILVGGAGLDCDGDFAATFRQTATSGIASGIETILDAVIDGLVAAVEQAGDGSSSSS